MGILTVILYVTLLPGLILSQWMEECGQSMYPDAGLPEYLDSFIVGGWEARPYEFPWQISMHRLRESGEFTHSCGGQIINQNWILTAAHCVDTSEPETLEIHVGAHNFTAPDDEVLNIYKVEEIIFHENYDPSVTQNDIAVLRLAGDITFTENVQPVCPAQRGVDYENRECVVSGWGALSYVIDPDNRVLPDTLQFTRIPITPQEDCVKRYDFLGFTVTDDMICGGRINETEHDACQGDSGGPLVCLNGDYRYEIVGVVSTGFGCANRAPGIYARVSYFLDWIEATIGGAN